MCMVFKHKDPIKTMISGIPLILGLGSRMWDPCVLCGLWGP